MTVRLESLILLLKLRVGQLVTLAKVADMVKYLAEFKEFNQRFQKSMYASHKELWVEINSIKSKRSLLLT